MKQKIIIIGPAYPLRGGLATFNQRLATEFIRNDYDCSIYSFSLQYPSFLFPGKTQYSNEPAPGGIKIFSVINSINPFNWIRIGNRLRKEKPDIIVVRYWLPFMGPALGTLLRRVRKNRHTKIICIADNVIPHEKRIGDKSFTRYFLKSCDAFITMSEKVMTDLRIFQKEKPASLVSHPLYDNFGEIISKEEARKKLNINNEELIILFFGFIRKYKGLDLLLNAMANERIKKAGIKLLIAGEFYEDKKPYFELIEKLGIKEQLILHTDFIPDSEVKYYFCAADAVIQPYRNATQSGVTPLAYHFEKPMIVTNVGGLPTLVPDGKAGLVTEPDSTSISNAILKLFSMDFAIFLSPMREIKKKLSWDTLLKKIEELSRL
ncbi:MAG: glycosyltransferase [Bacteroidetes bacterium]|nr:glycosyltransferase [Bacteroidota bacterium]MBS1632705.1 glycosyltransferase [Bacteroidota bacterium]